MDSGREEHASAGPRSVAVSLVTISDTRTLENDTSADYLEEEISRSGHKLVDRRIVRDKEVAIREALQDLLGGPAQVVISSGGTGIAGRDVTIPIVTSLIVKPMPGFGELFRMLSYNEVGGAAMLSRAIGGLADGGLLFALPGSRNAVRTGWDKLLKDELSHLVFEVFRHGQP
jgi:molybdenum cofactor biosynthesis protein B